MHSRESESDNSCDYVLVNYYIDQESIETIFLLNLKMFFITAFSSSSIDL